MIEVFSFFNSLVITQQRDTFMNKLKAFFISCACLASSATYAGTVSGVLTVQAEVGQGCQIDGAAGGGGTVNFGVLDFGSILTLAIDEDVTAQTSGTAGGSGISLTCTNGTDYSIALNDGENYTGTSRAMKHAGSGSLLEYALYKDPAHTDEWTSGAAVLATSDGTTENYTVYGVIRGGQVAAQAGVYEDNVQVTISW